MTTEIAPGVVEIDTMLAGWDHCTAGYLVGTERPVLVEPGSQSSVNTVLTQLQHLGVGANDLSAIVVTHIHLDHAGGVGDLAQAFPDATIYVHPAGARHLVDPTRLIASAATVFGDNLDRIFGRLAPTDAGRVVALNDGDTIPLSTTRDLVVLNTPGHAKHHVSLLDSDTGIVFAGDSVGVRMPEIGMIRPATPPPDFDLEQTIASIEHMRAHQPTGVAFAHYGLVGDVNAVFDEAIDVLNAWGDVAARAVRSGVDIDQALYDAFDWQLTQAPEQYQDKVNALNGTHSNAMGFERWLASPCGQAWRLTPHPTAE